MQWIGQINIILENLSKKEELKEEIENVWHIYTYANECFHTSYYLHKPKSELESDYLNNSSLFKFMKHSYWRLTVIELAKIFSNSKKRDRYNLLHIISKLKKNGYYRNFNMSSEKIEKWEKLLLENQDSVQEILTLRDKIYSHTDPNKDKYVNSDITFERTQKLFDLTQLIITEVYLEILDSHPHFQNSLIGADNIQFVKILAENKKKSIDEMVQKFIQNSNKNKSS